MFRRLISICGLSLSLLVSSAHAAPRAYPGDLFDDLILLFDIITAYSFSINIENQQTLNNRFPGRSFSDFDRNKSGGFVFTLEPGVDPRDLALNDVNLALIQFNHDIVDYDQDGILGFFELECEFANRVAGAPKVVLSPINSETYVGVSDADKDCDGDGLTNKEEIDNNLNPLDGADATGDVDNDGLSNVDERRLGTNPFNADTDGDGFNDADEIGNNLSLPIDVDNDGIIDALDDDHDNDGRLEHSRQLFTSTKPLTS